MPFTILHPDGRSLTFDGYSRENYTPSGEGPAHPLERGGQVTDHFQRRPLTFTITATVTHSPFDFQAARDGVTNDLTGAARINAALSFLDDCMDGTPLTVVSSDKGTIEDVILLSYPHDFTARRRLPLSLSFQEIAFAETGSVIIPPDVPRAEVSHSAPDEQDLGPRANLGVENTDKRVEEDQSVLLQLGIFAGVAE